MCLGHNCVETDHSTDTTTMTAVSPLHSVYAVSGGGGTAGSEHTYHRYIISIIRSSLISVCLKLNISVTAALIGL